MHLAEPAAVARDAPARATSHAGPRKRASAAPGVIADARRSLKRENVGQWELDPAARPDSLFRGCGASGRSCPEEWSEEAEARATALVVAGDARRRAAPCGQHGGSSMNLRPSPGASGGFRRV